MNPSSAASEVLNKFWDLSLPVNSVEIANRMGLKVFLSNDLKGHMTAYDESKREIVVLEATSLEEKRFSVASCIGRSIFCKGPRWLKRKQSEDFAMNLLMPNDAVQVMVEVRYLGCEELCKQFGVTTSVLRLRLEQLGYI